MIPRLSIIFAAIFAVAAIALGMTLKSSDGLAVIDGRLIVTGGIQTEPSVQTQSDTNLVVDFGGASIRLVTATNDLYFTGTGYAAGLPITLVIKAGTTNRNLLFDPEWIVVSSYVPETLSSNKVLVATILPTEASRTNAIVSCALQP